LRLDGSAFIELAPGCSAKFRLDRRKTYGVNLAQPTQRSARKRRAASAHRADEHLPLSDLCEATEAVELTLAEVMAA